MMKDFEPFSWSVCRWLCMLCANISSLELNDNSRWVVMYISFSRGELPFGLSLSLLLLFERSVL